jgi:hypothetical protein
MNVVVSKEVQQVVVWHQLGDHGVDGIDVTGFVAMLGIQFFGYT